MMLFVLFGRLYYVSLICIFTSRFIRHSLKRGVIKIKAGYARGLEWYFMVRRMDLNVLFAKGREKKPRKPKKKKGGFL